jgi:hypothetical protein
MLFAWAARERIRVDGPLTPPPFRLVALHAAAIVVPLALYFYLVHGEWAWMYLLDPGRVPGLALLPLVLAHAGLVLVGWFGMAWVFRRAPQLSIHVTAGVGVTFLAAVIVGFPRLTRSATYAGYHLGAWVGWFEVELGYSLLVAALGGAGSIVYVVVELLRDGRRVRGR